MKKIAIALYVISILLISGLARAEAATLVSFAQVQYQAPVHITQVAISGLTMQVVGVLPSACYRDPSAILTHDAQNPNLLILRLSAAVPSQACIARIVEFSSQVDLPTLAQASLVNIDHNAVYQIKVEGIDYSVPVNGSDLLK